VARYKSTAVRLRQMNESILERSEETLQLMQKAFRAGKVGASDVLAAQDNLLSVRQEYVQAQNDYIDAVRALEISTGGALSMSAGS
jgi:cobalt-zinc-cadmium efflux system outer membrane protein